ncbi:MAG: hypothetical protein OXM01_14850 [Gemmatimonadota bacterium]|nr:hypothetical protein [Gemmatimonadota bacterium]
MMKWNPFRRESRSFAQQWMSVLFSAATGATDVKDGIRTAALQGAVAFWRAAITRCRITGDDVAVEAVSPELLGCIVERMLTIGECVFAIDVVGGEVQLTEASTWTVEGGPRRESWRYLATFTGPTEQRDRVLTAAQVLHFRYAWDAARPWVGIAPLARADLTGQLAGAVETGLLEQASSPRAQLLPVAQLSGAEAADKQALAKDLAESKGRPLIMDTAAGFAGGDRNLQDARGLSPVAVRGSLLRQDVELRTAVLESVYLCCGLPSGFTRSDGPSTREDWRLFSQVAAPSMCRRLEAVITSGIAEIRIDPTGLSIFDRKLVADAHARLLESGIDPEEARVLAGLTA